MAQLNDLLVMGQSTLLGPVNIQNNLNILNNITVNGILTLKANQYEDSMTSGYALNLQNSNIVGINSIYTADLSDGASEGIHFYRTSNSVDTLWAKNGILYFTPNRTFGVTATSHYQILHSNGGPLNGQISTTRTGGQWIRARDNAVIRYTNSIKSSSYSPIYSIATNGQASTLCDEPGDISCGMIYGTTSDYLVWEYNRDSKYTDSNGPKNEGYVRLMTLTLNGQLQATSFNATSDARLKENFQQFTPTKSILDLPIYKFDFVNGLKNQIGCKAQDLQEICPEIVDENSDGYLSIQESKIVYLLIDEIKKLKKEINLLQDKRMNK